jgi:hypothetical protein
MTMDPAAPVSLLQVRQWNAMWNDWLLTGPFDAEPMETDSETEADEKTVSPELIYGQEQLEESA